MNCYTVSEFHMNEDNNTFSFRKNYMINGKRFEDKKILTGNFLVEEIDEQQCRITITVNS